MVEKNKNNDLLYDICFGLMPIKFEERDSFNNIQYILKDESEVTEIYLIIEG